MGRVGDMFRLAAVAVLAALTLAACGDGGSDGGTSVGAKPRSIVVLGDSLASGEGIDYGYTYSTGFPNHWTGGTKNPTWAGDYQLCHQSLQAYGDLVASAFDADLATFACTGSTYDNGIAFDRRAGGQLYRPAQFGDWLSMRRLNAAYDAAKPDTVIVTLGADDVHFVDILTFCATGYTFDDADEVEAIGALRDPGARIRANFVEKYPTLEALTGRPQRVESSYCTAANPGSVIESEFWDPINSGEIAAHYIDLVTAIRARGQRAGQVPRVVFTTYHNPLPGPDQSIECLDLGDLTRAEINYTRTLIGTLNDLLKDTVAGLPGVSVADISHSLDGHEFCTDDPWTYGLTVLALDTSSNAPFHPTPAGQQAIAAIVEATLRGAN
jgi:lysophospholipase L1-like esterase